MNKQQSNIEIMIKHINAQAYLFEKYGKIVYEKCLQVLKQNHANEKINKIYITGCGDSYYAGICLKDYFIKTTSLHTECWQALEMSHYVLPNEVDENSMVVSISASGQVARTAECALRANQKGALSIAITTNPNGRLAKVANEVLYIELEENLGLAPGTQSYCASLLSLYCLATALGKQKGVINDWREKSFFDYMNKVAKAMRKTAEKANPIIKEYVDKCFDENKIKMYHLIASGPNFGTAQFGVMKLLEAAGFDSLAVGTEEWAHSQFFTTNPSIGSIVLANFGKSKARTIEILPAITVQNGTRIVIGEQEDEQIKALSDYFFPICGMNNIDENFAPLLYAIPLELLAMHISAKVGHSGFQFDEKPWVKEENFKQIFRSKIEALED